MKKEIKFNRIKSINTSKGFDDDFGGTTLNIKFDGDLPIQQIAEMMRCGNVSLVYGSDEPTQILDDEERKYLKEVIRPFRDRVDYIEKSQLNLFDDSECYIEISIDDEDDCVSLPNFDANDMYLGMELDREYSLEELGL
jgi:hypothetical protein